MSENLDSNIGEIPKASASPSQSAGTSEDIEQKRAIIELSNTSILHGYDLAIDVLVVQGKAEEAKLLQLNRALVKIGLDNSINEKF
ncbi:MAG: hypothetical protein WCT77_01865 [Bacteroidota bacterium]|jgi:hypothetical protein